MPDRVTTLVTGLLPTTLECRLRRRLICCLLALLPPTSLSAQNSDAGEFPDAVEFDAGAFDNAAFDDSMFDGADLFDTATEAPRNFRFQLSQQTVTHLSKHRYSTPAGTTDTQHRGLENNRLGLNIRYQNPFAAGWLLQSSAQLRAYLPGDYEHDNPGRDGWEWRLNELFLQRSGAQNSFSFGRQTIVWGETIGMSVLDVINTTEYRDLTIIDIEDARLNQWLAVWDHFSDSGSWSSFINLYPEFDPVPVTGSPLFPEPAQMNGRPLRLGSYDGKRDLFEAGTRWNRTLIGSDIAVMAARLYENALRYTLPTDGSNRTRPHINDFILLGFSANRAIDRLLLTLDVAYSHGLLTDVLNLVADSDDSALWLPGFDTQNRISMAAGFEYGISATQQVSLGVQAQRFIGLPSDSASTLWRQRETEGNALLRYSQSLRNEELMLSATAQAALDGDEVLLNLTADYRLSDTWEVAGQIILTHAASDSALFFLERDVRAGLTLSWSF
ncbi:hypothetical protein [Pseudohongiella sp.]|uniref:TonB-dependent receptor-like beta-barrel domain-containing protein n=1 Tax=marine sediment metagenome TaxID=412755 RepID=A0A0F9W5S1_9ZZZZ|nr:hypothetical protein [Pseudohongiella sp.]HDZ09671.1 hypothetical protein [Pseudohongiella sp.]HEA61860.1 hypothetical protein [Pseudohongiella sp.]